MKGKELFMKGMFFFEKRATIHITCEDGRFYNGLILEISEKLLILQDKVLGETPVFFSEIKNLERFKENE